MDKNKNTWKNKHTLRINQPTFRKKRKSYMNFRTIISIKIDINWVIKKRFTNTTKILMKILRIEAEQTMIYNKKISILSK